MKWQWTITQILEQPEDDLDDVLTIREAHNTVKLIKAEEKHGG